MKSIVSITLAIAVIVGIASIVSCTRIQPGYVGIKVNYTGSNRGVEDIPVVTGWAWANPLTQKIFEYPTFVQTAVWTKDKNEGKPVDESLSFNSKDGAVIGASINLSYQIREQDIPKFYVRFRSDDLNKFTHGFLRNLARDAFNEVGGQFTAEEMNGPRKEEFLNAVKAQINKDADAFGVVVEQFGLVGNLDLPSTIVDALNAKIAATQNAIRAENELRQAEAEAKKTVAKANGEAEANRVLTASLTPTLIQWQTLQVMRDKWNGALPQVSSGNGNFLYQLSH